MSIFEYNGGTIVGMVGKDCVGIAADRRFGKQMLTLANDFQRVFKIQDNIIMIFRDHYINFEVSISLKRST